MFCFYGVCLYIVEFGFSVVEVVKKFILGIAPAQLWFLPMLFWIFLLFLLLDEEISKIATLKGLLAFYALSVIASIVISYTSIVNIFQFGNALRYAVYFYLGALFRQKTITKIEYKHAVLSAVISVGGNLLVWKWGLPSLLIKAVNPVISFAGIVTSLFVAKIITFPSLLKNRVYIILKKNSMPIYLLH